MMRSFLAVLLPLAVAAAPVAAQNLVRNGDFSSGLTGWTTAGVGSGPKVESYDVAGFGASACFGVNPGPTASTNPPYDYRLSQLVPMASSLDYALRLDVVCDAPGFNNDGGTVTVKVGGVRVATLVFGQIPSTTVIREIVCTRFRPTSGGMLKLEIALERRFLSAVGRTPRLRIDDVRLEPTTGPVLCVRGTRQPGTTSAWDLDARGSARFAVLIAPRRGPGFRLPPIRGTLALDPATMVVGWGGQLDAFGVAKGRLSYPNDPSMAGVPLWFQPVMADAVAIDLGPVDNSGARR